MSIFKMILFELIMNDIEYSLNNYTQRNKIGVKYSLTNISYDLMICSSMLKFLKKFNYLFNGILIKI
jgi:hypothetical protein